MALVAGSRLGPYEVTAWLGAGGMGQTCCARDTKLDRNVALEILPEAFLHDADTAWRGSRARPGPWPPVHAAHVGIPTGSSSAV